MIKIEFWLIVEWQVIFKGDFFSQNMQRQSDVVFDLESNDVSFSSLAPSGGEKKHFQFFLQIYVNWYEHINESIDQEASNAGIFKFLT